MSIMRGLEPRSVLDVGCGFGKYGVLLREYFDIWQERMDREEWQLHLEGIEAFEKYHNPIHDYVYNKVYFAEAQKVFGQLGQFDVVLIADVIEHLEKEEAVALVKQCFEHAPVTIISTPRAFYAQQALNDNPYEMHRNHFTRADVPSSLHVRVIRAMSCDVFVVSREPLKPEVFTLTEPVDFIYLRSRKKLGNAGLPLSLGLRQLCRWLG
jgi:SAM-dependent methyltransferase